MSDQPLSQDELLGLLGNCLLALALTDDEGVITVARAAADKHLEELNQRFPGWEGWVQDLSEEVKENIREMM